MSVADISRSILQFERDEIADLVQAEIDAGTDISVILEEGLIGAMEEVGDQFSVGRLFVPEMLQAAETMKTGLEVLRLLLVDAEIAPRGTVVIGTVKGDLHDIGKNLVGMMLEGAGFTVIDLGVDVKPKAFIDAAAENQAQLVAMSALLTTTMPVMGECIRQFKDAGIGARIIVGSSEIAAAAPQSSTVDFAFQCKHMKADWPQPGTAVAKQQKLWPSGGALWLGCECFDQDIDGDGEIEPGYETGCPELWEEASPAAHVAADSVPHAFYSPAPDLERPGCVADGGFATFFRTCGSDAFRSDLHARNMAAALERAGVYNRLYLVSGGDHVFHRVEPWFSRVLDDLLAFVDACVVRSDCDALAPPDASPGE